jgi:hypothetical protein
MKKNIYFNPLKILFFFKFNKSSNYNAGKPSHGSSGDMQKAEEAIRKLIYSISYYNINISQLFKKYDV